MNDFKEKMDFQREEFRKDNAALHLLRSEGRITAKDLAIKAQELRHDYVKLVLELINSNARNSIPCKKI